MMYRVLCTVYFVPCTLYFVPCTLYRVLCTMYDVLYTLYALHIIQYCTVYCVRHVIYFQIHNAMRQTGSHYLCKYKKLSHLLKFFLNIIFFLLEIAILLLKFTYVLFGMLANDGKYSYVMCLTLFGKLSSVK